MQYEISTEETIELENTFLLPTYKKMPLVVVRGQGSYVWDADGHKYLDFYGGHCVTPLGHCPPRVVQALNAQAETLLFYSNVVYNPTRARAAALMASLAPSSLKHVYFCNSGTEANETALKLARKWTGKPGLIAMEGSFHGRTLGSLAATWEAKYRDPYQEVLPETVFVPFGNENAVDKVLADRDDIAALILEPIQSMAGIRTAPDVYFQALRSVCDKHGVALIFDEIQTGVGRTGTFSISEQLGIEPDMITMAKGLGSGIPVGAVLTSDRVSESVQFGDQGTTFGGGMLAMAALIATLETLQEEDVMLRPPVIFERVSAGLSPLVREIRGAGCLIGIEMDREVAPVVAALRNEGILTGGSADPYVIRLMPPLNLSDEEVDTFVRAFKRVLNK